MTVRQAGDGETFSQCHPVMYPPGGAFATGRKLNVTPNTSRPLDGARSFNGADSWSFTV